MSNLLLVVAIQDTPNNFSSLVIKFTYTLLIIEHSKNYCFRI